MRLRSGTKYNFIKTISIKNIVIVQSIVRRYISVIKYGDCIRAIRLLQKTAPHLYKYKPKTKKKSKKKPVDNEEEEVNVNDLSEILSQYKAVKDLGRKPINGVIRSKRKNKGKNPNRYIDPNFKKIFMEDNTIEDFLGSDSDDMDSDDSGEEDIVYSAEEDEDWDSNEDIYYSDSDVETVN